MNYQPEYDTTIRTSTVVERHNTLHTKQIDWNYPFDDPEHTACMCCSEEGKAEQIEQFKAYLRTCEMYDKGNVYASNYGGWPRIWHRVIGVGMASAWPYWKPRPVVLVEGVLGTEWYDWMSLTGAKEETDSEETT